MKYNRHVRPNRTTKVKNIPDRVSIHQRPAEADGTRFGDWEMDTIVGKDGKGAILTLTERSTNMILMERLPEGTALSFKNVLFSRKACYFIGGVMSE